MARPRSSHTLLVKEKLIARLHGGFYPPGHRFFSNRGLAAHFGISYQTAHRLIQELTDERWLERRPSAGTYVSGKAVSFRGVALIFHERSERAASFGARLLADLTQALEQAGIETRRVATGDHVTAPVDDDWLPVLWECPRTMAGLAESRRFLLVLNDTPQPGLASSYVDSVACDDFAGGAAAAELLRAVVPRARLAVLAGPRDDHRSQQRVAGFQSRTDRTGVFWAASWDAAAASKLTPNIIAGGFAGLFCCCDRLAEGWLSAGQRMPVVGFDDAPVAETLNLTTIGIPWAEMVAGALDIIRRRISGNTGAAAKWIFAPRPVTRASHVRERTRHGTGAHHP